MTPRPRPYTNNGVRLLCAAIIGRAGKDAAGKNTEFRQEARDWLMSAGKALADMLDFSIDIDGLIEATKSTIDRR